MHLDCINLQHAGTHHILFSFFLLWVGKLFITSVEHTCSERTTRTTPYTVERAEEGTALTPQQDVSAHAKYHTGLVTSGCAYSILCLKHISDHDDKSAVRTLLLSLKSDCPKACLSLRSERHIVGGGGGGGGSRLTPAWLSGRASAAQTQHQCPAAGPAPPAPQGPGAQSCGGASSQRGPGWGAQCTGPGSCRLTARGRGVRGVLTPRQGWAPCPPVVIRPDSTLLSSGHHAAASDFAPRY